MDKFNELLQFIIDNRKDDRISIYKKMKYGYRHYYVSFYIDEETSSQQTQNPLAIYKYGGSMNITFDNRNKSIEIDGGDEDYPIIIEDHELLEKWSSILEEIVNENIEKRIVNIFEKTLEECYNKNLHRELQMKKILE
jgi:hypothetical protein